MTSATKTGLIGEHIALSSILLIDGFSAAHTPMDKVDIIAWDNIGSLRIQVKASSFRLAKNNSSHKQFCYNVGVGGKKRMPTKEDFDILAFVAIDERKCFFRSVQCLKKISYRIDRGFFYTPDIEFESWQKAVSIFRGEI